MRLTLKAEDFDVRFEGVTGEGNEILLEDATPDKYNTAQPLKFKAILTPKYTDAFAMGTISLSVRFEPEDEKALLDKIAESDLPQYNENWLDAFFAQGSTLRLSLLLGSATLDYAADMVELRLDASARGAVDKWEMMVAEHYKMRKISGEELSSMYCAWAYRDRIYASVESYMTVEHTVRFSYMSKNIRYRSNEYVDAPEVWELYEKVRAFEMGDWRDYDSAEANAARRELAEYILLYMKEQGIITKQEYDSEAAWMEQVSKVGNFGMGFDQNIARYSDVIQKHMYTH